MNRIKLFLTTALIALSAVMTTTISAQEVSPAKKFGGKDNWELRLGYTIADFDRGSFYGGALNGRWGLSIDIMRNVYLHRTPIAGMLKFGLQFGPQFNYINFAKGHGSLSGIISGGSDDENDDYYDEFGNPIYNDDYDDEEEMMPDLGKHQLVAGLAIGPTVTIAPFINSSNKNLSRLKFRGYFNVVPAFSAIMTANEDETELNSAFTCMYAGGLNIIWRKLDIGFQYKGGRARYKDLVSDLMEDLGDMHFYHGKAPRFATNLWTVSIGLAF